MDVIFDIDGTLADVEHRRHFVTTKPKNWRAFSQAMVNDEPIWPTVHIFGALINQGHRIILASGREEPYRGITREWLINIGQLGEYERLYMRKTGDYRKDDIVKEEILDKIIEDEYNPFMVFDDRPQVVRMWRRRGLFVFDVNQTGEVF